MAFYILNLPVVAKFYKDSEGSTKQRIETYTRGLFVVVFFVFGLVVLLARTIIGIVFGDSYMESEGVLRILMVAFLIQSAEMVLGMSCQAAGYHKQAMHISVFRAMANVGLNLILIPMWGILGAALATLFSVVFSFLVFQFYVARTLHGFRWTRITLKPALVCSLLMVVLYPFVERLNILVLGIMFLLGYGVSLLVLNGFFPLRADSVTPP
jgi:O-antigen/teichoic acid export membrane protein